MENVRPKCSYLGLRPCACIRALNIRLCIGALAAMRSRLTVRHSQRRLPPMPTPACTGHGLPPVLSDHIPVRVVQVRAVAVMCTPLLGPKAPKSTVSCPGNKRQAAGSSKQTSDSTACETNPQRIKEEGRGVSGGQRRSPLFGPCPSLPFLTPNTTFAPDFPGPSRNTPLSLLSSLSSLTPVPGMVAHAIHPTQPSWLPVLRAVCASQSLSMPRMATRATQEAVHYGVDVLNTIQYKHARDSLTIAPSFTSLLRPSAVGSSSRRLGAWCMVHVLQLVVARCWLVRSPNTQFARAKLRADSNSNHSL